MSFAIPIRKLLSLRQTHGDQVLLDYLELATLARDPGLVPTEVLKQRWGVTQPNVSRRLNRLAAEGLADITATWGGYQIHELKSLEVTP